MDDYEPIEFPRGDWNAHEDYYGEDWEDDPVIDGWSPDCRLYWVQSRCKKRWLRSKCGRG